MVLLGLPILLALQAQQPTVLSLDDALKIGVENSFKVRLSKLTEQKSRETVRAALASVGFRLDTQVQYQKYFNPIPTFGGGSQADAKTANATLSFGVDINRINAMSIRATKFGLSADQASVIAEINNTKQAVRAAYYNAVRSKWVLDIRNAAVASTSERERVGAAKKREGVLSNFDLLRIETDLQTAKANARSAQTTLDLAKASLNSAMARNPEIPFEIADITLFPEAKSELNALSDYATKTRPELQALEARIEQAALNTRIQRSGNLPSLNVALVHQRVVDPTAFQRSQNTIGQITLSVPLYDGGATRARVDIAKKDLQAVKIQSEQLKLAVRTQVQVALLNLQNAREQMTIAEENLKTAAEARRLADVRFNNGLGIVLDTIQAQEALTSAEAALAQARYQYLSSFADLQLAVGDDNFAFQTASTQEEKK